MASLEACWVAAEAGAEGALQALSAAILTAGLAGPGGGGQGC
jgi:hypothetical protein